MTNEKTITIKTEKISHREFILKIKEWWDYLLARWAIIITVTVLGALLGLSYSIIKKTQYKAEVSFALDDKKSGGGLGGALGIASQFGIDLGGGGEGAFAGDNLLELMKSRLMIEKSLLSVVVINGRKETLADIYIEFNGFRDKWKDTPGLQHIIFPPNGDRSKFSLQQDSLLSEFYKSLVKQNLVVEKLDKKLSIIVVNVTSKNELFSKLFAETLVDVVSNFYVETRTKKEIQNVNILSYQTDSVRSKLSEAINGVAQTSDMNPNANPLLQTLRVPSQKRQVDVQANTAILTELVKNLEIAKVSLRKETPLIQAIDTPILPLEKIRFSKAKGTIIGGGFLFFATICYLMIRKYLDDVLKQ